MLEKIAKGIALGCIRLGIYYTNFKEVKAKVEMLLSEKGSVLDRYGVVNGTDKASVMASRSFARIGNDYLRQYDYMLQNFRADKFSLIEFGCFEGSSLRTWQQYFFNAEIMVLILMRKLNATRQIEFT